MKIRTTLKFHLSLVRKAKTQNQVTATTGVDIEKEKHLPIPGVNAASPKWGAFLEVPQKPSDRSAMWSSYISPGHIHEEFCILMKSYLLVHIYCCSIHNSHDLCTVVLCTVEFYSAIKKNEIGG